jgi:hypothetical protein
MIRMSKRRSLVITVATMASGMTLSACATEDYVDQHIATVNARIDETNRGLEGANANIGALGQRLDAVDRAAQDALQRSDVAVRAAQAASAQAMEANRKLDTLGHRVGHLERHHARKTWSDVSKKKRSKRRRR